MNDTARIADPEGKQFLDTDRQDELPAVDDERDSPSLMPRSLGILKPGANAGSSEFVETDLLRFAQSKRFPFAHTFNSTATQHGGR